MSEDNIAETNHATQITCPDCMKALSRIDGNHLPVFRCENGHSYSGQDIADRQRRDLVEALRSATVIVEEQVNLAGQMAVGARIAGDGETAVLFDERGKRARIRADLLGAPALLSD